MCGLAGLLSLSGAPADPGVAEAMADMLRHRGPDDGGVWHEGPVALAHKRLSILDLTERGRNPMASANRKLCIAYNGEIYNYRDLRRELEDTGLPFASDSDTEVIVNLHQEVGDRAVERLNGMFAYALWDIDRRRLLLARDRFGVKPLYYTVVGDTLAFASEIKAFLRLPGFRVRMDPVGLSQCLSFQNMIGAQTLFAGVKLLEPGCVLSCDRTGIAMSRFWDLELEPAELGREADIAGALRARFEAAVTRQLVSDVPVSSYLSGGMDTGSISAVAARHASPLSTYTCGFEIPENSTDLERFFDEREASAKLARHLQTRHRSLVLDANAMQPALPFVTWHLDEPRAGISYQVYYTARMIRRDYKVVLSGVGGDELFAGYPWRYARVEGLSGTDFDDAYYHAWCRLMSDEEKRMVLSADMRRAFNGYSPREAFDGIMRNAPRSDSLARALYYDFKTFLNGLLIVDDKLSMAHSLEARVPFLDNELVDYARTIPSALKFRNGTSKLILRKAMRGLLPDEVIDRRKQGFTPPDETWYRGQNLAVVTDLLLGSRASDRGVFDPSGVRRILEDHTQGRRNRRFLIWSLMALEWWQRLFIDGDALPDADSAGLLQAGRVI